jgi:hypothetical protein
VEPGVRATTAKKEMIDKIKKLKYAQPFKPFAIELSSGSILVVSTPDHVAVAKAGSGRVAVLNNDGTFYVALGLEIGRVVEGVALRVAPGEDLARQEPVIRIEWDMRPAYAANACLFGLGVGAIVFTTWAWVRATRLMARTRQP